jgi:hypothetical protein
MKLYINQILQPKNETHKLHLITSGANYKDNYVYTLTIQFHDQGDIPGPHKSIVSIYPWKILFQDIDLYDECNLSKDYIVRSLFNFEVAKW